MLLSWQNISRWLTKHFWFQNHTQCSISIQFKYKTNSLHFYISNRYTCGAINFGIPNNNTHQTQVKRPAWLVTYGVTEKRSWKRLGMNETNSWPRAKNMASRTFRERQTGSVFLKEKHCLEKLTCQNFQQWYGIQKDETNFCQAKQ